jgi:hypothetical protein
MSTAFDSKKLGRTIAIIISAVTLLSLVLYHLLSSGGPRVESYQGSPSSSTTNFLASAGKWYGIEIDPFGGPFDIKPSGDNITWFARVVQVGNFTNSLTMHPNGRKINWGNGVTNVWVMSPKDVSFLVRKQVR